MYNVLLEEIPYASPQEIFEKLQYEPYPFLLESSLVCAQEHFSFIGCAPYEIVSASTKDEVSECLNRLTRLNDLKQMDFQQKPVPFIGGAVGFITYDFARCLEKLSNKLDSLLDLPYFHFAYYSWIIACDNLNKRSYVVSTGFPHSNTQAYKIQANENLTYALSLLSKSNLNTPSYTPRESPTIQSFFTQAEYEAIIKKTVEYIKAGDIFQANITQPFLINNPPPAWEAYKHLSYINPAPFSAYLAIKDYQIVSASPERFIKKTENQIVTSPIKGTRKRGENTTEDKVMQQALWNSAKDRAELAMIIDLERNDLNKFCIPGSVHVPELYRLEQLPSVWHLVSDVFGTLESKTSFTEIIKSVFPGGSITGAPKIRAMEIIEDLEKFRRGLYTGCIGYIGFDGDFDFNIVIRTAIYKNGQACVQAGGGITALSDPRFEYEETLIKAKKIFDALGVKDYGYQDK